MTLLPIEDGCVPCGFNHPIMVEEACVWTRPGKRRDPQGRFHELHCFGWVRSCSGETIMRFITGREADLFVMLGVTRLDYADQTRTPWGWGRDEQLNLVLGLRGDWRIEEVAR